MASQRLKRVPWERTQLPFIQSNGYPTIKDDLSAKSHSRAKVLPTAIFLRVWKTILLRKYDTVS